MDKKQERRRGRPALPAGEGKRYPLGIRTTAALKEAIEDAAQASGRSIAQEIEYRLERSFAKEAEEEKNWGGPRNMAALHALGVAVFTAAYVSGGTSESWLRDPEIFEGTIKAWRDELKATGIAPALKDYPDDERGRRARPGARRSARRSTRETE